MSDLGKHPEFARAETVLAKHAERRPGTAPDSKMSLAVLYKTVSSAVLQHATPDTIDQFLVQLENRNQRSAIVDVATLQQFQTIVALRYLVLLPSHVHAQQLICSIGIAVAYSCLCYRSSFKVRRS